MKLLDSAAVKSGAANRTAHSWPPSAFGTMANPATSLLLLATWITLALWFNAAPGIDIAISRFFHDPLCAHVLEKCARFPLSQYWAPQWFRKVMHNLPVIIAAAMLCVLALEFRFGRTLSHAGTRARAALVLAYIAGPGLFANVLTKNMMGRPRPSHTDIFGGDLPFVPAAQFSDYCPGNCSFVSGEASSAFWLLGLLVFVPARHFRKGLVAVGALAFVTSMMRVGFGGHYFSDVVLGGLSTIVILSAIAAVQEQARDRLPVIRISQSRG
ncbi:MAG: phosphatase PAP2 family protein [Rhodobiaceae bacterium]|nr:phosphatase PAP2 family protein [Rhodobiaceae bacterium]